MITAALREKIRQKAGNRCGYCLAQQEYVLNVLEIDHILPMAAGGDDSEENLWLACRACNNAKGVKIAALDPLTKKSLPLFNPRKQNWREHFRWNASGLEILGITPAGRATVLALDLNNVIALMVRRNWIKAGWHPPRD
ncbi:HNH endonuclease [candidate division KSB1 bacterium]|nr:MAG: HNH endonuclease [candidate division KSB1 bacterium]